MPATTLDQLLTKCKLDLDEFNLAAAKRYPFEDMTSNQALLLAGAKAHPSVLSSVVSHAKDLDLSILDKLAITLCLPILPYLKGRVHFQLSPSLTTTPELISHGRRIISLATEAGIPLSRVSLKIPITPAGMLAALELRDVACLGTMCFNVAQGVAAGQAGCVYVAPYFNELAVHFEKGVWREYDNPMLSVVGEIVETFRKGGVGTRVMAASIVTGREVVQLSRLGIDDVTIPVRIVEELEGMSEEVEAVGGYKFTGEVRERPDLLAGEGERLGAAIEEDESAARRLEYAIATFARCERELMELVRAEWERQGK